MEPLKTFEITTKIGCSVNCLKYCPQEVITGNYKGERMLSLDTFKALVDTVPPEVTIIFAGVSEPFGNKQTVGMMWYAHEKGHKLILFSTLVGLSINDARRIVRLPLREVIIHLPDSEGNAHIAITGEYLEVLSLMMMHVKNIRYMSMSGCIVSDRHEDHVRGTAPVKKGRTVCYRNFIPSYVMMPNGDVYFCCQTKGQSGKVGSLYENTYPELLNRFESISKELQMNPTSVCHYCSISDKYWVYRYAVPIWEYLRSIRQRLKQ
jgi:radical SAM protein with 4Fe4S-binding SPASM domain